MLGKFVTAKLFNQDGCRQGWVISTVPLIIQGHSGIHYHCSDNPVEVINPPLGQNGQKVAGGKNVKSLLGSFNR